MIFSLAGNSECSINLPGLQLEESYNIINNQYQVIQTPGGHRNII